MEETKFSEEEHAFLCEVTKNLAFVAQRINRELFKQRDPGPGHRAYEEFKKIDKSRLDRMWQEHSDERIGNLLRCYDEVNASRSLGWGEYVLKEHWRPEYYSKSAPWRSMSVSEWGFLPALARGEDVEESASELRERRRSRDRIQTEEVDLGEFIERLRVHGEGHTSYFHYTNWNALKSMMKGVSTGPVGRRVLLLTAARKMNDRIERLWGDGVYFASFSYSRYEDVAMWMNYGKENPEAIRIRLDGDRVREWLRLQRGGHGVYAVDGNVGADMRLTEIPPGEVESIGFSDVGYVVPTKLMTGRRTGNVMYGRKFYRVPAQLEKCPDGKSMAWSDEIYKGKHPEEGLRIPAVFKKRGWGYERETRLVVSLKGGGKTPDRIAVDFEHVFAGLDGPDCPTNDSSLQESFMSGPWFKKSRQPSSTVSGMRLGDFTVSDYADEIRIITPNSAKQ